MPVVKGKKEESIVPAIEDTKKETTTPGAKDEKRKAVMPTLKNKGGESEASGIVVTPLEAQALIVKDTAGFIIPIENLQVRTTLGIRNLVTY